jgi:NADH:ubiquinone oxidoreductase subunit 6 (subunit J)
MSPTVYFMLFASVCVGAGLFVLFSRNILHAAVALLLCFMAVAGIFVLASADFLAVSQLMVYVGGILVLVLFGILLTQKSKTDKDNYLFTKNQNRVLAIISTFGLFAALMFVFVKIPFQILVGRHFNTASPKISTVQKMGLELILSHGLALEIVGVLLLGTLIGAGFLIKNPKI